MAWVESHQALAHHPKMKRLARLLGIERATAIGYLHLLWWWALDYAPDGSLDKYHPDEIADGAEWTGSSDQFLSALIDAGFVDEGDDGLALHDWHIYAGRLIDQKRKNAERMREARATAKKKAEDTRASNVQRTYSARAGATNHTYLTNKKDHVPSDDDTSGDPKTAVTIPKPEYSTDFEEFWTTYPRKIGKKAAYAKWRVQLRKGVTAREMIFAATNYATECVANATAEAYVKHAATFLGPQDPFRDYLQPVAVDQAARRASSDFESKPRYVSQVELDAMRPKDG